MGVVALPLPAGARPRPWSVLPDALDATLGQPALWLLGTAGFLVRGGFMLLLLTVVAVPSPVELRLWIGDGLGSTGFSGGLVLVTALAGLLTAILLLGAMWVLAALELASFERVDPAGTGQHLVGQARNRTMSWLYVVQTVAFLIIGAATVPLISAASSIAYQEILAPTGSAPLYERVLAGIEPQLLLVAIAVVLAEVVAAVGTRATISRAFDLPARSGGRGRWRPLVAAVGWTITAGVLAPAVWALTVVWRWVSAAMLGVSGSQQGIVTMAMAVVILAAVWGAILVLAGFASALRGALWTMQELR